MAMSGARPVLHRGRWPGFSTPIVLSILVASLIQPAGVAAQSLDWVRNPGTGHWYAIIEDVTWPEAEAAAIQLGGHLATINDRAEDRWISKTFPSEVIIGFNDLAQEGVWVWASGEPVTYTNWLPEEPTDGSPTEDVAEINFVGPTGATGWNDRHDVDLPLLIEVVSPVAPPAELPTTPPTPTPTPTATPTPAPPSLPPSPGPTVPSSPVASASPQASGGTAPIIPGGPTSGGGYRQSDMLVPGITTRIPTPGDVLTDPSVLWTNLLLAALVMVMLTIATELLNRSIGEIEPVLSGRFPIVRRLQRALARLDASIVRRLAARQRPLVDVVRLAGIAAFYGIVFAFLDPTWDPLTVGGVWLVATMAIAVGVVGLGGDIAAWVLGRRWGVAGDLEIKAGGLLAALGSTLVSRAFVLVPGLMIGSPEVIEIDPDRVDQRRLGSIAAVGIGTVLLIGLGSWALTLGTSALRGTGGSLEVALGGAEAFLLLVFAFAVQNAFVQLLSIRQSGGLALRRTHPVWWGVALLLVTFMFWQTLVNPGGDLAYAVRSRNVLAFLTAAGLVLFVSLALWVGTRLSWLRLAEPVDTAATRAIDLQRTFRLGPKALAENVGIDTALAKALRWHLGIEDDPACRHDFVFGKLKRPMYSDRALERMRGAIAGGADLSKVRKAYQEAGRP